MNEDHVVEKIAQDWLRITGTKKGLTEQEKRYVYEFAVWLDKFMKGDIYEQEEE